MIAKDPYGLIGSGIYAPTGTSQSAFYVGDDLVIKPKGKSSDVSVYDLHEAFLSVGIKQATFLFEDGTLEHQYCCIDTEQFQVGRVGDIPTHYLSDTQPRGAM